MKVSTQSVSRSQRKRIRLPADAYHKPATWYLVTICCRRKQPHFQLPKTRDLVQHVLQNTATVNHVQLAAYSILPDHLHLICSAGEKGLIPFLRKFKSRTAVEIIRRGAPASPWQGRFFDDKIRSDESVRQKCEYVWTNPVRRGLARRPEDYPWNGSLLPG